MHIRAGAEIVLRTVDNIDTASASDSSAWAAVVVRDVTNEEGDVIIGSGSPARLAVAGQPPALQLVLRGVMVHGNSYLIGGNGAPLTLLKDAVLKLDPWGSAASASDLSTAGERVRVPSQALLAFRIDQAFSLE
jgi:hypothetical protein